MSGRVMIDDHIVPLFGNCSVAAKDAANAFGISVSRLSAKVDIHGIHCRFVFIKDLKNQNPLNSALLCALF